MKWPLMLIALLSSSSAFAQASGTVNYFGAGGAKLYIDGEYAGKLPMSGELTEGSHTFRVEPLYTDPFEITRDVQFNGQRSLDLPISEDEPVPETEEEAAAEEEVPDAEKQKVPVKLYAPMDAVIHYNGMELGPSPISMTIPEGEYVFRVVPEEGAEYTSTQTIKPTGASSVNITLTP